MNMNGDKSSMDKHEPGEENSPSFWKRYGAYILLGALVLYVVLLAIGTYGELTHNEKILNWWLFK